MRFSKPVAFGLLAAVPAAFLIGAAAQNADTPSTPPQEAVAPAPAPEAAAPAPISQGEYLARVGNCIACHAVAGGEAYAGGLKMAVPGFGFIYTTNITPDPETGIGNYTFEDFDTAMRRGKAKDGHRLYP